MPLVESAQQWLEHNEALFSALLAILVITVTVVSSRRFFRQRNSRTSTPSPASSELESDGGQSAAAVSTAGHQEFSLAVLRFEALSDAPDDEHLAAGISAEVIALVTMVKNIRVSATNSSFKFRAGKADIDEIADRLNANFVLSGSLRRIGDQIQVVSELTDVGKQEIIWANNTDRPLADVFKVQREIAQSIVGSILGEFKVIETSFAFAQKEQDLDAWGYVQKAYKIWLTTFSREALLEACDNLRKALQIDPGYSRAKAVLAMLLAQQLTNRICDDYQVCAEEAGALIEAAYQETPGDMEVLAMAGVTWQNLGDKTRAIAALRQVIDRAPLYLIAKGYLAMLLALTGGEEGARESRRLMQENFSIAPKHPSTAYWQFFVALAEQVLGNQQQAMEMAEISLFVQPGWTHNYFVIANAHALNGDRAAAEAAIAEAEKINPGLTAQLYADNIYTINGSEAAAEAFVGGLKQQNLIVS